MAVLHMSTAEFEAEVLNSDVPVLVDFWAEWCGPCKMLGPIIEQVAEEVTQVKICKINVDEEPELARKYKIMSIPTLMLFENGQVTGTTMGVMPKEDILDFIGR